LKSAIRVMREVCSRLAHFLLWSLVFVLHKRFFVKRPKGLLASEVSAWHHRYNRARVKDAYAAPVGYHFLFFVFEVNLRWGFPIVISYQRTRAEFHQESGHGWDVTMVEWCVAVTVACM